MRTHSDLDDRMMLRCLQLALRGQGRVEPNPMVGCVIVRNGRTIGEGWHRRYGGPHAEVEALRRCTVSPRGATAYVSLEPCRHFGKTPPCVDALMAAGVARVVYALNDPLPEWSGGGAKVLRKAGIEVVSGVRRSEAAELIAPFLTRVRLRRPYVIAKWAQSLDGKLATTRGNSQWISCPAARRLVHRLRARVDGVLVGMGTVRADHPRLTARGVPIRRVATRIVLDGALRIARDEKLVTTAHRIPTLVFTSAQRAAGRKAAWLRGQGVEVAAVRTRSGRIVLRAALAVLYDRGMTNLLVEGGAEVLTDFFRQGLVDEAHVFVAPMFLGGDAAPAVMRSAGFGRMEDALQARTHRTQRVGTDLLYVLRFGAAG